VIKNSQFTTSMGIMAFALFCVMFTNIVFLCIWMTFIWNDRGFINERLKYRIIHIVILVFSGLVSHWLFWWSYSALGGMKHLSGQLKQSKTVYFLLSIVSIFFCNVVSIVAAALNFYYNLSVDK